MLASEGEKRERFVLVFCFFLVRITVPRDGRSYTAVFVQHSRIHGPFYPSLQHSSCNLMAAVLTHLGTNFKLKTCSPLLLSQVTASSD